jgi:hypothetical protein
MTTRPEAGEENARDDDGLELLHGLEPEEEDAGVLQESGPRAAGLDTRLNYADSISGIAFQETSEQSAEVGSLDFLPEHKTKNAGPQLEQDIHSDDGDSSIPDDTPSIQVPLGHTVLPASADLLRAPFCLHFRARRNHSVPQGLVLAQRHPEGLLTGAFSLASRHRP